MEINNELWSGLLANNKLLTMCSKLLAFQYRLNSRILTTNITRHKWNKDIGKECYFCKSEEESVIHLLLNCSIIKKFWNKLVKWLDYFCNIQLQLEPITILFNMYRDSFPLLVNTIILITKQYIYATKCKASKLDFKILISKINHYRALEYNAAKNRNKITEFTRKWEIYDRV